MGMFDTLHDNDEAAQVKCLGKRLGDYRVGDEVTLHRISTSDELDELGEPPEAHWGDPPEKFAAWADHPHTVGMLRGFERPEVSWQILLHDSQFATVRDHRFVGIGSERDTQLVLVDRWGRDIEG